MIQQNQVYKCNICGNIVEVAHAGAGALVCCGEPMELLAEKTEDQGHEKHVPVIEKTENGIKARIGSIPHPMEDEHFIQWIEAISDGRLYRKFLKPGDAAEAEFAVSGDDVVVREYCNLHGLWRS